MELGTTLHGAIKTRLLAHLISLYLENLTVFLIFVVQTEYQLQTKSAGTT